MVCGDILGSSLKQRVEKIINEKMEEKKMFTAYEVTSDLRSKTSSEINHEEIRHLVRRTPMVGYMATMIDRNGQPMTIFHPPTEKPEDYTFNRKVLLTVDKKGRLNINKPIVKLLNLKCDDETADRKVFVRNPTGDGCWVAPDKRGRYSTTIMSLMPKLFDMTEVNEIQGLVVLDSAKYLLIYPTKSVNGWTLEQVEAFMKDADWNRAKMEAKTYKTSNHVVEKDFIGADVEGSQPNPYNVRVYLSRNTVKFRCTCPDTLRDGKTHCKHGLMIVVKYFSGNFKN